MSNELQVPVEKIPKDDRITPSQSLYSATSWQIFWRNFLAGISRGLGSIIIWMIFIVASLTFFINSFWPHLKPMYDDYQKALSLLGNFDVSDANTGIESLYLPESQNSRLPAESNPILPEVSQLLTDPDFQALLQKFQNSSSTSQ